MRHGPTIDTGHLNGGSKLDAAAGANECSTVQMFLGNGVGGLTTYHVNNNPDQRFLVSAAPYCDYPTKVVLADMDQDGFNDIVVGLHGEPGVHTPAVSVLINKLLTTTGP